MKFINYLHLILCFQPEKSLKKKIQYLKHLHNEYPKGEQWLYLKFTFYKCIAL